MTTAIAKPSRSPVVAITGGSMGLGYALAETLLGAGFAVATCARSAARLERSVAELSQRGPIIGWPGDVADPFFRSDFIRRTIEHFGRLDAVVNNASILGDLPMPRLLETTAQNLRAVFEVNTLAPLQLIQQAAPYLRQRPLAVSVVISSDAAVAGYAGWGVYGASKAALDLLHKTLAAECDDTSILFYTVDPSDMQTAMHEAASPGDEGLVDPRDVAAVLSQLFMPLLGTEKPRFASGCRLQVRGDILYSQEAVSDVRA